MRNYGGDYVHFDQEISCILIKNANALLQFLIFSCKATLTFESAQEILKCDHLNESYRAVL